MPCGLGDPELASRTELEYLQSCLLGFEAHDDGQERTRGRMLAFATEHPDALWRTQRAGHFTASGLVLRADGRCLLTHHRKLGRWLQLGGHCDGEANPARTALTEAIEESGIRGITIEPQCVDLDIHTIPARGEEPEHLHLDLRYVLHAPEGAEECVSEESLALAWVARGELAGLGADASMLRLWDRL